MIRLLMVLVLILVGCSCRGEPPEDDHPLDEIIYSETDIGVHPDGYCGQDVGDDVCNLVLKDQDYDLWVLHENLGDVIVIDFSVMWCGPCQMAALTVEKMQQKYQYAGFQYVTVLIEDEHGHTPDREDAERWAEVFGIRTAPVLQGSRDLISEDLGQGWPLYSWPTIVIIDRNMVIHGGINGFSEEWIETNIQKLL